MNTDDVIYDVAQARGALLLAIEQLAEVNDAAEEQARIALTATNTAIATLNGMPCRRCASRAPDVRLAGDHALVYCDACDLHGIFWLDGRGYNLAEVKG